MRYFIELVWNREFDWTVYGELSEDLEGRIAVAKGLLESGDGARVKKARVLDNDGNIMWPKEVKRGS